MPTADMPRAPDQRPAFMLCDARQLGRGLFVFNAARGFDVLVLLQHLGLDPFDVDDYVLRRLPTDEHPHAQASLPVWTLWKNHHRHNTAQSPAPLQARAASGPNLLHRLYFDVDWNPGEPDDANDDQDSGSEDRHDEEANACVAASDSELDPSDMLHARFLVLRLYCTLLPVDVDVRVPATIQEAIDAVALNMPSDVYSHFSELVAVFPQVDVSWGAMLALPAWASSELVVVFDVRQVDGRLFAAPMANAATYAHFCAVAGLPDDGTYSIFPFGSGAPMLPTDVVETRLGGSVAIVPAGHRPASRGLLSTMLTTAEGWDPQAALPQDPRGTGEHYLCMVLEASYTRHTVVRRQEDLEEDLARRYGFQPHLTTVQPTRPRVSDACIRGWACRGVVLLTGEIPNVPIPPGRRRDGWFLAVVDCRPILQGWHQLLVTDGTCSHSDLADFFEVFMPEGLQPQIEGAPLEDDKLLLHPGAVLTVQYVPITSDSSAHEPSRAASEAASRASSEQSGSDLEGPDDETANTNPPDSPRSRSPRTGSGATCASQAHLAVRAMQCSPFEVEINQDWYLIPLLGSQVRERLSQITRALANWSECSVTCRVPSSEGGHGSAAAADQHDPIPRLQLPLDEGHPVPGELAPVFAQPAPDADPEDPPPATPFQATFLVLGHGYWPEWIEVTLSAPCTLGAAPGLGILVALPRWVLQGVLVVCDTSRIDGRGLFTVFVAEAVNLASLFAIAEVQPSINTVVYVGDMPWPLSFDQVVRPRTGQLIMYAPVEHQWLVLTNLADVLLSEVGWLSHPPIPGAYQRRLWIMPETEPFHFELRADRQLQLRTDVAHILRCPPRLLRLRASARFKPWWEAATLMETLFEHFGVPIEAPTRRRTVISLEEAIPLSAFQRKVETLQRIVPAPRSPAQATLMDWLDSDLSPVFEAAHISPHWKDYYAGMQYWHASEQAQPPSHLLVYTDGSAVPSNNTVHNLSGPAAWAFAVWAVSEGEPFFLGASAHVAAPSDTPFHVGEHLDTPLEAELLALTWAMAWLLDAAAAYSTHVELRYDCTSAGGSIFASSREVSLPSADAGPTLASFASQLRQTVERRFHLTHAHVKGHSQEPGNELCDILSGIARRHPGSYYDRCLPVWPAEWRRHSLCQWGWLAHHSSPDLPSLMSMESEAARLQALDMPILAPSQGIHRTVRPELAVTFCWTAMSYNILTMFDPDAPKGRVNRDPAAGLRISGKRDLVKRQLLAQNVWVAGFQETRLPASEVLPDGDFLMLNTAATDRGHGGCALWFSLRQPYAHAAGKAVYLQRHEATVVSTSPRHLHALLETPHLCLYICVIHAPRYKHSTDTEPADFWTEQIRLISRRPPRADYLILADSNGHVGEVQTPAIQHAGAEPENSEGALFHDFLLELSAFLPSTCPEVHSGQHWTWQTPGESAAKHRLDFIGIPKVYLSADTLTLVPKRQALRRYMRAEDMERQRRLMLIGFAAWRLLLNGQAFHPGACAQAELWLQEVDVSLARALQLFDEHATAIRAAVKRDRIAYLSQLQQQVTLQDLRNPKALYAAVRKAFPQAKPSRRRNFQPLPSVLLEDGTMAADRQQCTERWIRHFGEQESGMVVTAGEYEAAFADPDIPVLSNKPLFAVEDIPTLADLEQTILGLKLGKAAGPDGLTGEALRLHTSETARFLVPLCLKSALCSREPTDWRGGTLMTLAKKAKATSECASFRSILLENVAAKVQHRVLRQRLLPAFVDYQCDVQAGQVPGVGVENIGLLVRTYQRWAWSQKRPSALTYFDLKTAFYRVIRQSIVTTNGEATDARFLALLHDLGVPDQALPELARHLYNLSVLQDVAVSGYNIARVADLFRGSWFRLQLDSAIVLTRRGSRPGDPLADLLFAFSFTALCRSIETRLSQCGVATFVPTCAAPPPWLHWSPVDKVGLPAWADDFVYLQSRPGTVELCQQVRTALEVVAACTNSAGMILSYGEDKTAILLSANCPRALSGLLTQDEQGKPGMFVENPVTRVASWVPVVDAYRHLGTVTVANARSPRAMADLPEEEVTLERIRTLYRPHPEDVEWLMSYIADASEEGPRALAAEFWLTPPATLSSSHSEPLEAAPNCFTAL
ncbi:Herc2 [Symbiodinium sp. KB8]|nr:Herc2 [Symbiodinium sp. KB8]